MAVGSVGVGAQSAPLVPLNWAAMAPAAAAMSTMGRMSATAPMAVIFVVDMVIDLLGGRWRGGGVSRG